MSENRTVSIMIFVLGLFLIGVGVGLAAITQTGISVMPFGTYYETIQPYLGVGVVLIIFGIIVLVGAFIMTRSKKNINERPSQKVRKRRDVSICIRY